MNYLVCSHKFHALPNFSADDQLIPQPQEMVEICFSNCKISYQSEYFVIISAENIEF